MTLLTPEQCRNGPLRRVALPGKGDAKTPANIKNIPGALASAAASVDVDFSGGDAPQRPDTPQNDDIMVRGGLRSGMADLADVLKGDNDQDILPLFITVFTALTASSKI